MAPAGGVVQEIPFEGAAAFPAAPLSWSQLMVHRDMSGMAAGTPYNTAESVPLPAGVTLSDVTEVLRLAVLRHEALRTVFTSDQRGHLRQQVLARGEVEVEVRSVGALDREGLGRVMIEEDHRVLGRRFDLDGRPCFRAVLIQDDAPRALVLVLPKLCADFQGARALGADVLAMLDARIKQLPPPPAPAYRSPREQALFEQSPAGQRLQKRALDALRGELLSFPARTFPRGNEPELPRYWRGCIVSTSVVLALRHLALRYRVSTGVVLLAALTAVLTEFTEPRADLPSGSPTPGPRSMGVNLIVGNRYQSALRDTVGSLTQDVPTTVTVAGERFADMVRATWSATMRAYRSGQHDPRAYAALVDEVQGERGERIDLAAYFNDLRVAGDSAAAPPTPEEVRAAGAGTRFHWEEQVEWDEVSVFVEAWDAWWGNDTVKLSLYADTAVIPPRLFRAALLCLEQLLTELTERELTIAEVTALTGAALRIAGPVPGAEPPDEHGAFAVGHGTWRSAPRDEAG